MRVRTSICFCTLFLSAGLVHADDKRDKQDSRGPAASSSPAELSAKGETIVYSARGVPAGELASTLEQVFDEVNVRVVAEPTSNLLILQVDANSRDAVLRLLEQLDKPLRSMVVQLHLLKTRGKDLEPLDTKALSGPTNEVLRKVKDLEAAGRIYVANRMELTVVENQKAMLQAGEQVAVVTGKMVARGGSPVNSYTDQQVGTLISVVTRATDEGDIAMQLQFEKSEIVEHENSDDATAFEPSSTSTLTQQTTVGLRNGYSALAGILVARSAGATSEESYLVVGATLLEASESGKPIVFRSFSQRGTSAARSLSQDRKVRESIGGASGGSDRYATYARAFMNKYDKNNDGVLTSDEWKSMPRDPSAADTNKDNKISLDEFASWIASTRNTSDESRSR